MFYLSAKSYPNIMVTNTLFLRYIIPKKSMKFLLTNASVFIMNGRKYVFLKYRLLSIITYSKEIIK